uniref:Uncharacterized protein n=1 Tax=Wuchereria bancrofti TaxID=6293 RepID=A0AAF5PZL0_WUCBA
MFAHMEAKHNILKSSRRGFLLYIPMICGVEDEECLVMKSAFTNLYSKLERVYFIQEKSAWQ